jgi:hypothetical protein
MNVEHHGIMPFNCEECGQSFPTAFKYKTHMEQHNPEQLLTRKFCCQLCNARFQNERQLVSRSLARSLARALSLFLSFSFSLALSRTPLQVGHMLSKHPDQPQSETMSLKCKVCDKLMKNYNQLQQHELEHRSDWKGFPCKEPGCGQYFKTRYLLTKHQVAHKGSNLTCQQCDRSFANEASYKSHLKLHERAKEKGEDIKSRGGRPRVEEGSADKSPRKARSRSTGARAPTRTHHSRTEREGEGGREFTARSPSRSTCKHISWAPPTCIRTHARTHAHKFTHTQGGPRADRGSTPAVTTRRTTIDPVAWMATVCVHTYIHTYIHSYMNTYILAYIYEYLSTYMYVCMHI